MAGSRLVPVMGRAGVGREVTSVGNLTAFRLSHTVWVSKAPGFQYAGQGLCSTFSSLLVRPPGQSKRVEEASDQANKLLFTTAVAHESAAVKGRVSR